MSAPIFLQKSSIHKHYERWTHVIQRKAILTNCQHSGVFNCNTISKFRLSTYTLSMPKRKYLRLDVSFNHHTYVLELSVHFKLQDNSHTMKHITHQDVVEYRLWHHQFLFVRCSIDSLPTHLDIPVLVKHSFNSLRHRFVGSFCSRFIFYFLHQSTSKIMSYPVSDLQTNFVVEFQIRLSISFDWIRIFYMNILNTSLSE